MCVDFQVLSQRYKERGKEDEIRQCTACVDLYGNYTLNSNISFTLYN